MARLGKGFKRKYFGHLIVLQPVRRRDTKCDQHSKNVMLHLGRKVQLPTSHNLLESELGIERIARQSILEKMVIWFWVRRKVFVGVFKGSGALNDNTSDLKK